MNLVFAILLAAEISGPLTPAQSARQFFFADPHLKASLVAQEPEVISPVAMAWDEWGKLYVAEMSDYPAGPGPGKIKMLQDLDGNGFYEKATVFEDSIPFPNGVLPWKGGLLVTAAPNIWFLQDTNGDGKADRKEVVLTGFAEGNQQLRVNGLYLGLDNWIYGANGRSDGEIYFPGQSNKVSLRGKDFRFKPEEKKIEAIAGRSQFGHGHDDWNHRFLSWNTIPLRHEVIPRRYLDREPALSQEGIFDTLEKGDAGNIFPLSPRPRTFNSESTEFFNALAGLTLYRGHLLGPKYYGNAFLGETLRNLVHRRALFPVGVTFSANRLEFDEEFLASSDSWFHPVNFATGPDGALYVADFYREFVEHPQFVPETLRNKVDWRTGFAHGRIWRIRHNQIPATGTVLPAKATTRQLVDFLQHSNGWVRDTAHRLLLEQKKAGTSALLRGKLKHGISARATAHAAWILRGLQDLHAGDILGLLDHPRFEIRRQAVQLSEDVLSDLRILERVIELAEDPEPTVRLQVALSLGATSVPQKMSALIRILQADPRDSWIHEAVLTSIGASKTDFFGKWMHRVPALATDPTPQQFEMIRSLGVILGHGKNELEIRKALEWAPLLQGQSAYWGFLSGVEEGMNRAGASTVSWLTPEIRSTLANAAFETARNEASPLPPRIASVRFIRFDAGDRSRVSLQKLAEPHQPKDIQLVALRELAHFIPAIQWKPLFDAWPLYRTDVKRQLLSLAARSADGALWISKGMDAGKIRSVELDPTVRQSIQQLPESEGKSLVLKKLQETTSDRTEVVTRFQSALPLAGSRDQGALLFAKHCLVCHSMQGLGAKVGPDLSGIAARPKEALLLDILDPSRQVAPDFVNHTVELKNGESANGFIINESEAGVTLRRANEPDITIARAQIQSMRAEGKSLMPEGLEEGWSNQDMADLLAFLREPDRRMLEGQVEGISR